MEAVEYVLGLTAVIIGLALTDIATSLHRLMRNTSSVRWDPLALLALFIVASSVVLAWLTMWWARDSLLGVGLLATVIPELILLFLMSAAVLPDDPQGDFDLGEFYTKSARYIWTLFALFQLSGVFHTAYMYASGDMPTDAFALNMALRSPYVPIAAALAAWPAKRTLHWLLLAAMTIGNLAVLLPGTLG